MIQGAECMSDYPKSPFGEAEKGDLKRLKSLCEQL